MDAAANRVVFPGDSTAFQRYHEKLDKLVFEGKGQVQVVHIGGSHIQADIWSQQARHRMQSMAPGLRAGRGLVFPYTTAKTNNPWWYTVASTGTWTAVRNVNKADSSTLGLAGISVTTRDTLTHLKIGFRNGAYPVHEFNRVKVLHDMDSSFAVEAWSADSVVRITKRVDAAAGFTEFRYDRYRDTLRLRFVRTDTTQVKFTLHGILLESDDPGIVYHAVGVNGAATSSYLRCQHFTEDLALIEPDLVVFSVGINDAHDTDFDAAKFERNYAALIARVRAAAPGAAILLTTNSDSYVKRRTPNRNAFAVRDAMMRLGAREGVAVWDLFGAMGGLGSIREWESAKLAKNDRIHFNREGYVLLGDMMYAALMEKYAEHLKRSTRP